eukprot:scaffold128969_cov54-Phaeocystis_antarctica.AAC.2
MSYGLSVHCRTVIGWCQDGVGQVHAHVCMCMCAYDVHVRISGMMSAARLPVADLGDHVAVVEPEAVAAGRGHLVDPAPPIAKSNAYMVPIRPASADTNRLIGRGWPKLGAA